jgi:hypothetical protein
VGSNPAEWDRSGVESSSDDAALRSQPSGGQIPGDAASDSPSSPPELSWSDVPASCSDGGACGGQKEREERPFGSWPARQSELMCVLMVYQVVRTLIDAGLDVRAEDYKKKTPLDRARIALQELTDEDAWEKVRLQDTMKALRVSQPACALSPRLW